jgi:hypothetical protein
VGEDGGRVDNMDWEIIIYYALGYLYSVWVGHWFVLSFSRKAWAALGEMPKNERDMPYRWTSSLSGIIDRVIYTSSLLFSAREFIAIWLAIKVAVQWKRWEDKEDLGKARASFHIFIIGTGLSLLYGIVGALIVEWLKEADYISAIAFPILLILLNLYFIKVAEINTNSKSKKK